MQPSPFAAFVAALRALRAAVDANATGPIQWRRLRSLVVSEHADGWRAGGTIVACDPAARAAFDAAHAVEDAGLDHVARRVFGLCAFDVVRDHVWFPGGPGGRCPQCHDACAHAWGFR